MKMNELRLLQKGGWNLLRSHRVKEADTEEPLWVGLPALPHLHPRALAELEPRVGPTFPDSRGLNSLRESVSSGLGRSGRS